MADSSPDLDEAFKELPILYNDMEYKEGGWSRRVERQGTVAELLEIWDIDDESEMSEMAQVLRHLRSAMRQLSHNQATTAARVGDAVCGACGTGPAEVTGSFRGGPNKDWDEYRCAACGLTWRQF